MTCTPCKYVEDKTLDVMVSFNFVVHTATSEAMHPLRANLTGKYNNHWCTVAVTS